MDFKQGDAVLVPEFVPLTLKHSDFAGALPTTVVRLIFFNRTFLQGTLGLQNRFTAMFVREVPLMFLN